MNLWIRSQDKRWLQEISGFKQDKEKIWGYSYTDAGILLGIYESKERALEVLDEINSVKYYKYLAELNFEHFIKVIQKYNEKEKNILLSDMNTYVMPES